MSDYSKLTDKVNGRKIQVDSAVRDGNGNKIDTRYITSDGYYEQLGAGYADVADNLTPYSDNSGSKGTTPFVYQTTGGSSDVGSTAELRELRGKTIVWNQLIYSYETGVYSSITLSSNNNVLTLNGTCDALTYADINVAFTQSVSSVNGHKYLYRVKGTLPEGVVILNNINGWDSSSDLKKIVTCTNATSNLAIRFRVDSGVEFDNTYQIELFDLTLLYGAGNEPTTIDDFERAFYKPYYSYNAGELLSSKTYEVVNTGINQWDEDWEVGSINENTGAEITSSTRIRSSFIKVITGQTYFIHTANPNNYDGYVNIYFYDGDKNFLGKLFKYIGIENENNTPFSLPSYCQYIRFVSGEMATPTYHNDICVQLYWDGSKTIYEPSAGNTYSYQLPFVEIRSAGNVYDKIEPTGALTRKVGIIDLGSLSWSYDTTTYPDNPLFIASLTNAKSGGALTCPLYADGSIYGWSTLPSGYARLGSAEIRIHDSNYTDAVAFKNALNGVYATFELNEPTQSIVNSFTKQQNVNDFGTQWFVPDENVAIQVPQGAYYFYPVDYKAFVDSLGMRQDIDFDASKLVSHTELTTALSGIDLSDYVDISSAQTITGAKTFGNQKIKIQDGSNPYWSFESGSNYLDIGYYYSGAFRVVMSLTQSNVQFRSTIIPNATNTHDLGSSGYKWKDLYLSGYLKGITTITQAQYDALVSGGTIDSDTFYFIEE